jgi:CheY-like chemotaxis protein
MPTILVVEDQPDIREPLCELLELEGYRVLRAEHGQAALAMLRGVRPDAIVLDVMMPVMDGGTFLDALAADGPSGIPVLLLSALGRTHADIIGLVDRHGCSALTKTVPMADFMAAIRRLCPAYA